MNVGRIEARGAADFGVHRRTKGEMATDADAHRAQFSRAIRSTHLEVVEDSARVCIVAGELLRSLEHVAPIRSSLVVSEDSPGVSNS